MLKDPKLNSGNTYSFKEPELLSPDKLPTEGTKTLWPNQSPSLALGKRQSPVQQRFLCHLGIPEHSMAAVNLGDGGFIGETDWQALAADLQLGFKIQNDLGALVCCIRR